MSFPALKWAFLQQTKKSTEKLVLLALANRVNIKHADLAFPRIKTICIDSGLNRKTVITALGSLIEQGLIFDTGKRVGETWSIKVYRLNIDGNEVPKTEPLEDCGFDEFEEEIDGQSDTENGTTKQSQKRNNFKNEAVPKTDTSSPVFTTKQSQKRTQAVPKTGHRTSNKPVKEPVNNLKIYTDHSGKIELDFSNWPDKPSENIFKDWKSARKLKKHVLTQTVVNSFGEEISKAYQRGFSVDQCLTEVINRGWQGFKSEWLADKIKPLKNRFTGFDQTDYQAEAEAAGFATELRI